MTEVLKKIEESIESVPDFPIKGVLFRDINPILKDSKKFSLLIENMSEGLKDLRLTKIVGIESRGFILGAALAVSLGVGFVPLRKSGKLPGEVLAQTYQLEYGESILEIQKRSLEVSDRMIIVDDVLATGGTARAAVDLCQKIGVMPLRLIVLIELLDLKGRELFSDVQLESFFKF
jgi:adenine phosphoribosyltransferase